MPRPTSWTSAARPARGAITWVTALILIALIGGGYLAWTWVPVYWLDYEVKQVVRDYMHQAVRNQNDAELVAKMIQKLAALDEQQVVNDDGSPGTVPTVQVDASAVTWERDSGATPPTLHVAFEYSRPVPYPLLDRWTEKTLVIDLTDDLERPNWGPAR